MNPEKIIVGSEEWCCFPQINIPALKARVDSGAKTSALHAVNIVSFVQAGDMNDVDVLITDHSCDRSFSRELQKRGKRVVQI